MCALVTGVQTCALPISRRARDGEERPGLYGQRMSARRTAPQAGHGAFRRQQGSRTDRPSHRGDGEGVRPVIVGVPLLRELRMKWSRNMPRNQRIITPDDIMDIGAFETICADKMLEKLHGKRVGSMSIDRMSRRMNTSRLDA